MREARIAVLGCIFVLGLLFASLRFTGAPYMALGLIVAVAALIWACREPKKLIYLLVVYCCLYPFLTSDMGLPRLLSYGGDLINVVALLFAFRTGKLQRIHAGYLLIPLGLFSLVATLSAVAHGVSLMLFLWEARNVYRFFAFMLACVGLLDKEDIVKLLKILLLVFSINLVLCSFESLVLHYGQDNTNGLFGSGSGGNAATDILLIAMSCLALFGYGRKLVHLPTLLLVVAASCYIATIAELKFYFVQLVLLVVIYVLVSKPSLKNFAIVAFLVLGIYVAIQLFYAFMPGWDNYFDLENLIDSSSEGGYGSADGLNRLTAINTLHTMFNTSLTRHLFGLGLGAGTYSQFFQAPLYAAWGEILHWTWFTDAQLYLETGIVGFACYLAFFVVLGIRTLWKCRSYSNDDRMLCEVGAAIAFFCVLFAFYNCALTVDPGGYLLFFFLSIPLVIERENNSAEWRESGPKGISS